MSDVINVYHRTVELRDGRFEAKIQLISPLREAIQDTALTGGLFSTLDEAREREVRMAEEWKAENAPEDAIIRFCN